MKDPYTCPLVLVDKLRVAGMRDHSTSIALSPLSVNTDPEMSNIYFTHQCGLLVEVDILDQSS